ncbi:MAG TPA: O-antigen ligase family protein [Acetobacteraceae bacterium]|nr:O-antigen ligase family protein [Acetobacteraceae bacterium]
MSAASLGSSDRGLQALDRIALGAVLLTPLFLLHAHGIAEGAIGVADVCFLIRSFITRDWAWLRTPWLMIGLALWAWVLLCSLPIPALGLGEGGRPSLIQALVMVRFPVLIAAMEHSILRDTAPRRWMGWVVAASAAYIAGQVIIQFVFGRNLYGDPASGNDGVLSGPFGKPRAGPPLARILLPALVPAVAALLRRPGIGSVIAGYALLLIGVAVMVLIGQRMPLLLTLLGIVVVALLLRQLRPAVIVAAVVAGLLLAASPVVAPEAHYRLVQKFSTQMETFAITQYGELYARALEIGERNPLTGLGMDGFRYGCPEPRYFRPSIGGKVADGGGAVICWHHPHNYYFEALDNGGFVGLALFCALSIAWLATMGRALRREPRPVLVGLFAAAVIQLWPIASTTGFYTLPVAGWSFLLLGWGMAEARWGGGG